MTQVSLFSWLPIALGILGAISLLAAIYAGFFIRGLKQERNVAIACCLVAWLLALILYLYPNFI
ncbi:MAG: hypothetical protein CVU44_11070 [Chloroflexi bacterium HGW-Chloroflexi-6]|nr:MAG: hypothetical protein CVU44_11070 [Chloroflexi bacterium HGW-Chloroflexi-6]